MLGRGLMLATPVTSIAYRDTAGTVASTTITKPTGVAVGDVVLIISTDNASFGGNVTTASGAAWAPLTLTWTAGAQGYTSVIWWKVLVALDVSNNWTAPKSGAYRAVAYEGKGANTVTASNAEDESANAAASVTLTGYTPTRRSRGTIGVISHATGPAPTGFQASFTDRVNNVAVANGVTTALDVFDRLSGYAGGNVVTSYNASPVAGVAWLLDIT